MGCVSQRRVTGFAAPFIRLGVQRKAMAETKKYSGGCHCGAVRFEVETDLTPVFDCNCSYCQKRGMLWTHVGLRQFQLLKGEDQLAEYRFNKRVIRHFFCRNCGISAFASGQDESGEAGFGINVRCLDDLDVAALKLTPFDGRSM